MVPIINYSFKVIIVENKISIMILLYILGLGTNSTKHSSSIKSRSQGRHYYEVKLEENGRNSKRG